MILKNGGGNSLLHTVFFYIHAILKSSNFAYLVLKKKGVTSALSKW